MEVACCPLLLCAVNSAFTMCADMTGVTYSGRELRKMIVGGSLPAIAVQKGEGVAQYATEITQQILKRKRKGGEKNPTTFPGSISLICSYHCSTR